MSVEDGVVCDGFGPQVEKVDEEDQEQQQQQDEIVLTEDQQEAIDLILKWVEGPAQEFRLGGYAGTGKTTVIKYLLRQLKGKIPAIVSAFTGKAVSVLRNKGVYQSCTLHSLLYHAEYDTETKKMVFVPRSFLAYDFVIVDEASMISTLLYDDLRRHPVKILFVGDPAQLEPVGDNPNLMRYVDYQLTKIHRQATKSPILVLANLIREGHLDLPIGEWERECGNLRIVDTLYGLNLGDFDVTICGKNKTRHGINARRRAQLERYETLVPEDRVICLKNSREMNVFNGLMMTVDEILSEQIVDNQYAWICNLSDEIGEQYYEIPVLQEFFGKDFKFGGRSKAIPFDYGYALTAHKSQGSEFDSVLVLQESLYNIDMARWLYTATTRASINLTIVKERV